MTLLHGNSGDLWKSNYQQCAAPAYNLLVHFTAYLDINCHWTLRNSGLFFSVVHRLDHTVSWPSMFLHEPSVSKRSPQTPSAINTGPYANNYPHTCALCTSLFTHKNLAWKQFHSPSIQSSVFWITRIYYLLKCDKNVFPFVFSVLWKMGIVITKKMDLWHAHVMKIAT